MSDDVQRLLQATYQSAHCSMRAALAAAGSDPAALLGAVHGQLQALDGSLNGFRQLTGAHVECRAGCSFCCTCLRVDARAHEVLLVAAHLQETRDAELLDDLLGTLRAHQAASRGRTAADRPALPCAMLFEGCCSIYSHRPAACRRYLSRSVAACEELWSTGSTAQEIQWPFIQEAGSHAALGLHNALVREGFDAYAYDFHAALFEALVDPSCTQRWAARQKAFSPAAESVVPEGFSQVTAIEMLREKLEAE